MDGRRGVIDLDSKEDGRKSPAWLAARVGGAILAVAAVSYLAYATWPSKPSQATYRSGGTEAVSASAEPALQQEIELLRREVADLRAEVAALKGGKTPPAGPFGGRLERVIDTGTLVIAGRTVSIHGLRPIDDRQHVASLVKFIEDAGGTLNCEAVGEMHRCRTANGFDIAAVVLSNGGGRAAADAPAEYRSLEQEAKRKKLGVWRS